LLLAVVAAGGAAWRTVFSALPADLESVNRRVRARFPAVRQLSTAELAGWLADADRPAPLLLDVREPAEFAVSHLPGAVRVDPDASPEKLRPLVSTNRAVVVYCSVGYRSSALAARLAKAGATNVANLEGSIFAWANEGRPLASNGRPASVVHPYDARWGRLLNPERRAPLPR
jgi:rhodanese-related sulfurtransferase